MDKVQIDLDNTKVPKHVGDEPARSTSTYLIRHIIVVFFEDESLSESLSGM
ncbi:hypothetical protein BX661DRAFT_201152 [Kickxella alabastrina]|uniref:uncharacterized protein n=1 Tax=Kickxella alabastrina TaxID=61397 RepID=UPI00221F5F31|nr:uncharacterized protein BX661DRAFT_201152 [Kickxella alabastrina]KAI7819887.1 hypothetical protein BX661DRAFT_201152 [Kickxella alabastrina]